MSRMSFHEALAYLDGFQGNPPPGMESMQKLLHALILVATQLAKTPHAGMSASKIGYGSLFTEEALKACEVSWLPKNSVAVQDASGRWKIFTFAAADRREEVRWRLPPAGTFATYEELKNENARLKEDLCHFKDKFHAQCKHSEALSNKINAMSIEAAAVKHENPSEELKQKNIKLEAAVTRLEVRQHQILEEHQKQIDIHIEDRKELSLLRFRISRITQAVKFTDGLIQPASVLKSEIRDILGI